MPKLIDVCKDTIQRFIAGLVGQKLAKSWNEVQWGLIAGMHPHKKVMFVLLDEADVVDQNFQGIMASKVDYQLLGTIEEGNFVMKCDEAFLKTYFDSTGKKFVVDDTGFDFFARRRRSKAMRTKRKERARENAAAATTAVAGATSAGQTGPTQDTAAATLEKAETESVPTATNPTPSATSPEEGSPGITAGRHDATSTGPSTIEMSAPEPLKPEPVVDLPYAAAAAKGGKTRSSDQSTTSQTSQTSQSAPSQSVPPPASDPPANKIQHGPPGSFKYHERVVDALDTQAPPTLKISNTTTKSDPPTVHIHSHQNAKMFTLTREEANGETGPKPISTGPTYEQLQVQHQSNRMMWACKARQRQARVEMPERINSAAVHIHGEESKAGGAARNEENQQPRLTSRPRIQFGGVDQLAEDQR